MDISNSKIAYYSKVLDILADRHRILASNIANLNTPGYHTKDINFQDVLGQVIAAKQEVFGPSETGGMQAAAGNIQEELNGINFEVGEINPANADPKANDVDIDKEMVKLSTNTLMYKAYLQVMLMEFKHLNMAIKERT
jgi:flagellar basal-body rod protein FlgB